MAENLLDKSIWNSPNLNGWVWVLDPNDTTDSPQGTDKRVKLNDLPVRWANIQNKPTSFPVSWGDVSNKPTSFPTSWNSIANIPSELLYTNQNKTITGVYSFDSLPSFASFDAGSVSGSQNLSLNNKQLIKMNVTGNLSLSVSSPVAGFYVFVFRHSAQGNELTLAAGQFRSLLSKKIKFSTASGKVDRMLCYYNAQDAIMEVLAFDSEENVSADITHNASGALTLNFDDYPYYVVSLEANVTTLQLSGGEIGKTYRFTLQQTGTYSLDLAPVYPITAGTALTQNELYLHEELDPSNNVIRSRVYQVQGNYNTVDFDTDYANGDLAEAIYLPDGVAPIATLQANNIDYFEVFVKDAGEYILLQTAPNM